MAPTSLDSLSDELLLLVTDWLDPVVAKAVLRGNRGTEDVPFHLLESSRYEACEREALSRMASFKTNVTALSSANQKFRMLLAPLLFRRQSFTEVYEKAKVDSFIHTVGASSLYRSCVT